MVQKTRKARSSDEQRIRFSIGAQVVAKIEVSGSDRFIVNPIHQMAGLNTYATAPSGNLATHSID